MSVNRAEMIEYLKAGKLMTICTTDGSELSAASVWYALHTDRENVFYFTSRDSRIHSDNIRNNGLISGSIVHMILEGLGQKTKGVFFSGRAAECANDDLSAAYEMYARRWPQVRDMFSADDVATGKTPMRMYKIAVREFTFVDEAGNVDDPVARVSFQ